MAALKPPIPQSNLDLNSIDEYKLRMENIIKMNINLDQFMDLYISDCTLEFADYQVPIARAIRKMENLKTLRLERIQLCSSTFLEIQSWVLHQLYLCHCETGLQVSSLFKNDMCYKYSLVELKLEGNRWSEIPNGIFQFRNLSKLSLSRNCITQLPDKFNKFLNLQHLELSHNRIRRLPLSIIALRNLFELDLAENLITELPDMFANLSRLQILSLSRNQLRCVPSSIFTLRNLTKLDLNTNLIAELPDKFANFSRLEFLSLSKNQLRSVPSSILSHRNLSELSLSNNYITELPDIINLPSLITLSLSNFLLEYLPPSIFSLNLMNLDISSNICNTRNMTPSYGSEMVLHSLKELSYRTILKHKLKTGGMLPNKLSKDLANFRKCVCGCKFVDGQEVSFLINLMDVSKRINSNRNNNNNNLAPIRGKMCTSLKSCFLERFYE